MVSKEQDYNFIFTYTKSSYRNDVQYGPSVMSNEKGHIAFKHRKLRKTKVLR